MLIKEYVDQSINIIILIAYELFNIIVLHLNYDGSRPHIVMHHIFCFHNSRSYSAQYP